MLRSTCRSLRGRSSGHFQGQFLQVSLGVNGCGFLQGLQLLLLLADFLRQLLLPLLLRLRVLSQRPQGELLLLLRGLAPVGTER